MTREKFEQLSEKEQIVYLIKHYTSRMTKEKKDAIINFVYDFDLLDTLLDDAEFDDEEYQSYEDSIGFVPHQDNARF